MLLLIEFLILGATLALWWYKQDKAWYSQYPPGPFRFPIIGNFPQLLCYSEKLPALIYKKLADIYGDVMFLKLGQHETVIFSSKEAVEEILTHEKAIDRFHYEFIKERSDFKNMGIIWGYGKTWQNLRRFTLRSLRDFGFHKASTMEVVINEEIEKFHDFLREKIRKSPDAVILVEDLFGMTVVNNLWRLVSGKAYDLNDPKILRWIELNNNWVKSNRFGTNLSDPFPKLRDWFPDLMGRTEQIQVNKELKEYGKELLEQHRKVGTVDNPNLEPETFIDIFMAKIEDSKNDPETDFTDDQFVMTILDLFLAGSETSSNTLSYGILYMLLNPEVQEKIQNEIDREVPKNVSIDPSMKTRLPFTSAAVLEMLRLSTVVPAPPPRIATEDFYFRGHLIKKGVALVYNLRAVHYDEDLWGDPFNFRPERFLNSDGTAIDQSIADKILPFGAGKRLCLGKVLAENTLFLYFASTLRKFKFVKVPGTNPRADEPVVGLSCMPKPYEARVVERQ